MYSVLDLAQNVSNHDLLSPQSFDLLLSFLSVEAKIRTEERDLEYCVGK